MPTQALSICENVHDCKNSPCPKDIDHRHDVWSQKKWKNAQIVP